MGLLDRFARPAPATATDPVEDVGKDGSESDPEKAGHGLQVDMAITPHNPHIDPEIEKSVVRKLDWKVTPLVTVLCKYCQELVVRKKMSAKESKYY